MRTNSIKPILALGVVFAALNLRCGFEEMDRHSFAVEIPLTTNITRVEVDVFSANLNLRPTPDDTSLISVDMAYTGEVQPTITTSVDGSVLTLTVDCDWYCGGTIDLKVPWTASIAITGGRSDVNIQDIVGDLDLDIENGDITVANTAGVLNLYTGWGFIKGTGIDSVVADVAVSAGGIDLTTSRSLRKLFAAAEYGDIHLTVPAGSYNFEVSIGAGGFHPSGVEDSIAAPYTVNAWTGRGSVYVDGVDNSRGI